MTIKLIEKTYSQETLQFILADYADTINNETSGEFIQVSSVQVYIDNGDPVFFNHIFTDQDPVTVLVNDLESVFENEFSEDWVVTIVTTIKHD